MRRQRGPWEITMSNGHARQYNISDWAAIFGRWQFDVDGRATYLGPQPGEREFGLCVSKVRFSEGDARITVRHPSAQLDGRIVLGYQSPTADYLAVGIGGYGDAYTLTHFNLYQGWREIVGAGRIDNLIVGRPYTLSIKVRGQRIVFEVDAIRIFEHVLNVPLPYGQLGLFAWGNAGGVEFSAASVTEEPGKAFVVMQFLGYEELYTDVIKKVTESFGLYPYRADEVFGPGVILEDLVRGIETAQIIIAEITPPNENVFYELGYAHALKKPTILLADKAKKLPFDLSGYRCLFYENSIGGKRKVEDALRKHLEAILHV